MVHFLRHRAAALTEALVASILLAFVVGAIGVQVGALGTAMAGTASISGLAYLDLDRDATRDTGEMPLAAQQLFLVTAAGTYVGTTLTGLDGAYRFDGLTDGAYRVSYAEETWAPMRLAWAPTTTGSVFPEVAVTLTGSATVDFGWRPVLHSTEVDAPISTYTGSSGLRVQSYTDAVTAAEVHDVLAAGLVGPEAATVTVFFGYGDYSSTSTSVAGSAGAFTGYSAYVYVTYASWLADRGMTLSHEYGHAWSLYHAYMTNGDPSLSTYLTSRGLAGDARIDSSYLWHRRELIAEDYRQLLGSPAGRSMAQANSELPAAATVAGLSGFLGGAFIGADPPPGPTATAAASSPPTVAPAPSSMPTPTVAPTVVPPTPTPAPSAAPSMPALSVAAVTITPAPVMRSASVSFVVSVPAEARVLITTPNGAIVRVLADGRDVAGSVVIPWDRRDDRGRKVKAGTYLLTVEATDALGRRASLSAEFRAG